METALSQRAKKLQALLAEAYPEARCELDHRNAYELLVATILSAQCTDARVNQVTPAFFARFPDAHALAQAGQEEVEELIKSTGFYRNKAKALLGMAKALVERHGGEVPRDMEAMVKLPGVGRKTANVVLGTAYDIWGVERERPTPLIAVALAVFGGIYLGWLGSYLIAVRKLQEGAYLTLMLYGCVAFSDSAAYFVGRAWGRHRLSPHVSPKKTWEGYVGSVIGGAIFGALVSGLPDTQVLTWGHGAVIGLLIGALGTLGDLGISAIKRQVGAKDSSHLIPGHGGILDRTDSVLVSAAIGYYYLVWFVF
uniref:Phosphatidate cytidylyltransferase n=1 Tax=Thermoanaerobaculum aquaticum TaxID=1312852 RepID=A0A7V1ZIT0_9BACT